MGLDMYLHKKIYVGANYAHNEIKGAVYLTKHGVEIPIQLNEISTITCEAMYWRKSNHIHQWFVDNVQDGSDDCGTYEVSIDQLKELRELCRKVDKDNSLAEELLPTMDGPFFGGTAYDEYYFMDIKDTLKALNRIIKEYNSLDDTIKYCMSYSYSSSW